MINGSFFQELTPFQPPFPQFQANVPPHPCFSFNYSAEKLAFPPNVVKLPALPSAVEIPLNC